MTADDDAVLVPLDMSLALARPLEEKVMCKARTGPSKVTGYSMNECTMHLGHVDQDGNPNAHVDTHSGARWKDKT